MDVKFHKAYFFSAVSFMYSNLVISPVGAICHPGDRFTDRLHDVGHHCSGQGSWHCVGQGREEECVLRVCPQAVFLAPARGFG